MLPALVAAVARIAAILFGTASSSFNAATDDLTLNYNHSGLTRVKISGGGRADLLLVADDLRRTLN
jgi:hypothetical protein